MLHSCLLLLVAGAVASPVSYELEMVVAQLGGGPGNDLAWLDPTGNAIRIALDDGKGALAPAPSIQTGKWPCALAAGQFTGSGHVDLAVSTCSETPGVELYLGDGRGSFTRTSGSPHRTGSNPSRLALGRFTDSGHLDVATSNSSGGNITVLLGDGRGGFREAAGSPLPVGRLPGDLVAGRFSSRTYHDLAVVTSGQVKLLRSDGKGSFAEAGPGSRIPEQGAPFGQVHVSATALVGFDPDGSGRDLLAATNGDGNSVHVLVPQENGGLAEAPGSPIPVGGLYAADIVAGRFSGSGKTDLAVASQDSSTISLLIGRGGGRFELAPGSPIHVDGQAGSIPALAAGRLSGSDLDDLLVASERAPDPAIWSPDGKGGFKGHGRDPTARRLRPPSPWIEGPGAPAPGIEVIGAWGLPGGADQIAEFLFEGRAAVASTLSDFVEQLNAPLATIPDARVDEFALVPLCGREAYLMNGPINLRVHQVMAVVELDGYFYVVRHLRRDASRPAPGLMDVLQTLCAPAPMP